MIKWNYRLKQRVTNGAMKGTIIDCEIGLKGTGNEHELYTVRWDNGRIEKNLFWNDIKEER